MPNDETRLASDVVDALEKIVRQIGGETGNVTVEAVFSNGSYVRGFVKRGPITADELRRLGAAT